MASLHKLMDSFINLITISRFLLCRKEKYSQIGHEREVCEPCETEGKKKKKKKKEKKNWTYVM
jgi:hypothetical protein